MFLLLLLRCSERYFCSCGGPVYYSHGSIIVSSCNNLYEYYYNKGLLTQLLSIICPYSSSFRHPLVVRM
jgi:hypothetical protein